MYPNGNAIKPDTESQSMDSAFQTDDKVTVLLRMWKNKETGNYMGD